MLVVATVLYVVAVALRPVSAEMQILRTADCVTGCLSSGRWIESSLCYTIILSNCDCDGNGAVCYGIRERDFVP